MENLFASLKTLQCKTTRLETSVKNEANSFIILDISTCNMYIERIDDLLRASDDLLESFALQCTEQEFEQHEEDIECISRVLERLKLQLLKSRVIAEAREAAKVPAVEVRLPKLDLPTFDGNLEEWLSFRDLYVAAIHDNTDLTGAQKLQYLKTSLKGDAAILLESVSITNDNYEQAWELLDNRYQNRREIVFVTLERLVNLPEVCTESPLELRKLVDTAMECVRRLKVMEVPVEHWDIIISYLIVDKIDRESKLQWELNVKSDEIPPLEELIKFLDQRCRALSNLSSSRQQTANSPIPDSIIRDRCMKCRENHSLNTYVEFSHNSSLDEKLSSLKDNELCDKNPHSDTKLQQYKIEDYHVAIIMMVILIILIVNYISTLALCYVQCCCEHTGSMLKPSFPSLR